jgi:WD40 repeat protein
LRTQKEYNCNIDVKGVALSADGQLAISWSKVWLRFFGLDKTLEVWDVATGRKLRTLKRHSTEVNNVALSLNGRLAVSAGWDRMLKMWDVVTGRELLLPSVCP